MLVELDVPVGIQFQANVLERFYSLFPNPSALLCAGGAPRDWFFGKQAKDLDVFTHKSFINVEQYLSLIEQSKEFKIIRHVTKKDLPPEYANPKIVEVIFLRYLPASHPMLTLQLIILEDNPTLTYPESVYDTFGLNMSKASFSDGIIHLDPSFIKGARESILISSGGLEPKSPYVLKYKQMFSSYRFVDHTDMISYIRDHINIAAHSLRTGVEIPLWGTVDDHLF